MDIKKIDIELFQIKNNSSHIEITNDEEITKRIDDLRNTNLEEWVINKVGCIEYSNKIKNIILEFKKRKRSKKEYTNLIPTNILKYQNQLPKTNKNLNIEIDFKYWLAKYPWNATKKVYINKNISKYSSFSGNVEECERIIMKIISQKTISDKNILQVIDLINQWGGKTSRGFYTKHKKNKYTSPRDIISKSLDKYKAAIKAAKNSSHKAFKLFKEVYGIGDSFSGKHAMFWSSYNLVVIDNKISGALGFQTPKLLFEKHSYEDILKHMSKIQKEYEFSDVTKVERAIFSFHNNFFNNSNTKFKENITDITNLDVAKKIAKKLKITIPDHF